MKRPEISASYKETSAPPNSSKKRKSTSDVWNHFIKETYQNGMVWAKCKHCGKCFSGSSKDGTTHLKNHLKSSKCKRSQKETGGLENPTVTNGKFLFDEERSGLDLVRMIIKNGYPLNMVEHEDFKILMNNLQPAFKLPSQDTLKDKVLCFYREEKEKLHKQFDKVLSFSLILNFWTDCGKKKKYCSFTVQFIEDGPKLMKKNIAIKNVEYNYTGETLFEIVKGVLLEWNIDKKLATITVESSDANGQMVKILDRWLDDQGNCHPFRKKIFHIPCITHVINLLVKHGLDEIDYILHKIRKAIKYRSETIGKQKFEEAIKKLNLGGKDITSEGVPVSWDSAFFMLQIALELRRQGVAFVDLQSSDCVFPMNLSVEEWDKAKVTHKYLTVFYDAICSFFGSKCLSTNVYFRKIYDISGSLIKWQGSDITKLGCFFYDLKYVYAIVAVLDPRTKLDFVQYSFEQFYGDNSEHWRMLSVTLGNMFHFYAENLTSQRSSSSFINNDNSPSSDGDDPCNILDDWKKSKRQRTELEKYLQEPLQPDEEFDILGWWHTKSQDSPTLWTMARDILAIPMSTSTSNSVFCIETMTLDPLFNDLYPDIIEALFCGKDWLDNPIRITPNKDNDYSTANPEPMLEISGSTSGLEPLPTGDTSHVWSGTLAPQEKHDPSNADTELMLANGSATSRPKPLPLPTKEVNKMKCPEISASYKVTSAPPNSSKKRKSTSDVWNHFIKETDQYGMVRAKCKHCGKYSSGLSKDGTTHLKNHLNSSKCKRSQKEMISSSETGGLENPTVTNGNFVFDEERSGLDLVRMIIKNGYPLNMVEHEDFKIFMNNLQPTFKLPSQDTLKDKVLCFYREEKEKLRKQFDKVLSFSLILNFWTDCGKKRKYCSFTLQFIEDGPKLMKKNIAIKNVAYNYTGETLFETVKGVLLEWNIDKKLATITVASSSANDQMVKSLDRWLDDQGNCHPFRKKTFHIPCITHVINLLVKDGLDEIDYILHKIRKAIKYMSGRTDGKQKFDEVVKKLNLGGKDITSEGVPVRWDSAFFILQIALELRRQGEAFVDLQSSDCFFPMNLSVAEWDKAKVVHKCLTVCYDAICSFFGSKCLSTNVYFRKIYDIYGSLLRWQSSDITCMKMIQKVCFYFDSIESVDAIVAVFDPRTKLDFVEYLIAKFEGDTPKLSIVLSKMFQLYAENLTSQRSPSSFINNDNSSSSDGDGPCNVLDEWKKSNRHRTELEKYLQEPLQPNEEFDILGWWHTKSQDSPTLWTMARDILAIPMSTSTSNSAFCIETMTLDPIFNDLDPDVIEALFCGKDWLDNPIRITSNEDNDHSIANPEPMLENPGSTSGPEPLQTGDTLHVWSGTLEPLEKHDLSNADMGLMLANCSATSCPEPIPLPTKNLDWSEIMNVFEPYTEIEKIICNYIFNEDLDGREVLVDMKYEFGDRAAFNALLPYQWITDEIINLVICKMTKEKRFSKIQAWYLPTRFSQRMMYEDGNPTLSWFKKSFRDNDKYMSKLVNCKQVTGLDKLLSYLENDNYTDSITKFALKSPPSNPRQNNGYDCGMYVIKHICTNIFNSYLPFLEGESERFRYKLAANLVLSKDNEQRSNIIERAKKFSLKDYFL
ncbi:uncharacterized protein LOC112032979 isoform X2 [Quercus suber]|uniref:uncharacterized protein LOC112032979 isoform X2 n=1 Tax=Quercus suber TaxID=58331 RepID=UPI0032DFD7C9